MNAPHDSLRKNSSAEWDAKPNEVPVRPPAASRQKPEKAQATAGSLGQGVSAEAGLRAAAILEVLAGERTAQQAAAALSISLPYFYLLERQALGGLVRACEPRPKGPPPPDNEKKLAALEQELRRCQRECQRQAALVRATQRAVGLPVTSPPSSPTKSATTSNTKTKAAAKAGATKSKIGGDQGARKRPRRPATRALQAARTVRKNSSGSAIPAELQPSVTEHGSPVSTNVLPPGKGDET